MTFRKEYTDYAWKYEGSIEDATDDFRGQSISDVAVAPGEASERLYVGFDTIELQRRPIYYWSHRPPLGADYDWEHPFNVLRAWRYALDAALHAVRTNARHLPWEFFQERRNRRLKYLQLAVRFYETVRESTTGKGNTNSIFSMIDLEKTFAPADLRFYRSVAQALARRAILHPRCGHYHVLEIQSAFADRVAQ